MQNLKRVLITGSSGMLGTDLSRELSKAYEVGGADLIERKTPGVKRFIKCDITDKAGVAEVVDRVKPDVVIHTAAWTDVDGCELDKAKAYKINAEGAANVAAACKNTGSTLIYISTDFVFDGKNKAPYKESDKPHSLNIYADSKLRGEKAVAELVKGHFILRTSWLYGRNGNNFVDTIIRKSETEKELKVVDDQVGSPTYTVDLAKAINVLLDLIFSKYAIRDTHYGIYHLSNSGGVSWFEYTKEIVRLAGLDIKVTHISSEQLATPAKRPAMSILDNSKFISLTGYRMRGWKDALKEYITKRK